MCGWCGVARVVWVVCGVGSVCGVCSVGDGDGCTRLQLIAIHPSEWGGRGLEGVSEG